MRLERKLKERLEGVGNPIDRATALRCCTAMQGKGDIARAILINTGACTLLVVEESAALDKLFCSKDVFVKVFFPSLENL
jgi:hypothetical protein